MPFQLTDEAVWKIRDTIKKEFAGRDTKWKDRRRIRFRQFDRELSSLPLNPAISDRALMVYQTEGPNQEAHKRTKRLMANPPRFEVVVYENNPEIQALGQDLENGLKALYKWLNQGKDPFDVLSTQYQQGDGLGIGKESFVPGHGGILRYYDTEELGKPDEEGAEDESDDSRQEREKRNEARSKFRSAKSRFKDDGEKKAYKEVTDEALKRELPPFRLEAPDPLSCYWWEDGEGIALFF